MNENMFESMAERLKTDISKEIAYAYVALIPNDTKKVILKMKSNISLKDRKFLEQDLQKAVGNNLIFPYDVLNSSLEKHITDFYDELNLSIKTTEKLSAYDSRGEKFKKEFADSLEQSKASTLITRPSQRHVPHNVTIQIKWAVLPIDMILWYDLF